MGPQAWRANARTFHLDDEVAPLKQAGITRNRERCRPPFHLDDEVAPLKPTFRQTNNSAPYAFHLDDEVAPLKLGGVNPRVR